MSNNTVKMTGMPTPNVFPFRQSVGTRAGMLVLLALLSVLFAAVAGCQKSIASVQPTSPVTSAETPR